MASRHSTCLLFALTAVVFCGLSIADVPQEDTTQADVTLALDQTWFNKTCKNIYCCIDAVLTGLDTTNMCLRVEGYGCHLKYQLQKFADTQCEMDGANKDTLLCHKNTMDCSNDLGKILLDTEDKDCSDSEDRQSATLQCDRGTFGTGSMICAVKNDTNDLSECPGVADCQYKKERVSCPMGWAPHKGHCYLYMEQKLSWYDAEESCQELGKDAHLTTIKRGDENQFVANDLQGIFADTNYDIWWTGLRRLEAQPGDYIGEQVFQWSDNQTFNPEEDYKNWGIDSPETDVNHCVYIRNGKWFLANCEYKYGYTCKMPAYKSLHCHHDVTTTMAPPIYVTQNEKQQPKPLIEILTTPMVTTKMFTTSESTTTQMITTKMMTTLESTTTHKITTTMMTTPQITTTNRPTNPERVVEIEASTKEVTEELKNVTRNLKISEEAREEINQEMTKLTTNVGDDTEESSAEAVQAVDNVVDLLVASLTAETLANKSEPIIIQSDAMVVQVYAVTKPTCEDESESCSGPAIGGKVQDQTFNVDLPASLADSGATLAISTVVGLEDNMATTMVDENQDDSNVVTTIASLITSIAIARWDNQPVIFSKDNPLVLTFSTLGESSGETKRVCSYWEPEKSGWSRDGCQYSEEKSNTTHTTCECTHLTSFAVLMQVTEVEKAPAPKSLDYLTYIGCGLSIFCLLLLILIFLVQRMHRSDRNLIHMNLALSLLIAQIIFVIGIDQTQTKGLCKAIAACLHYFLLAVFCWMLNEAIYLLSKTTSARKKWLRMPFFVGIGWGTPAVIVGVTLGAGWDTSYNTEDYCWLSRPKAIWAFVGPAILIILINASFLIKVIHVFLSLKANMNKKKKERLWLSMRAMLLTLPLLGVTWLVGIFSMDHKGTLVFAYLFVILNSLQGVFIFVLYCVMNDEVKKGLEKRMSVFSTRSSMASTPSSKSSSREPGQGGKGARPSPGSNA